MKKLLVLLLAASMGVACLSGCGKTTTETTDTTVEQSDVAENKKNTEQAITNESEASVDWASIYTDFLIKNEGEFTEEAQPTIAYIGVNDLNFDGVPEITVSGTVASAAYYFNIFQIQDGTVKEVDFNQYTVNKLSLYSHFLDGWMTVRKNKNDGTLKYVIFSSNGSSEESFGNTISVCADDTDSSKLKITNEFEYIEYWGTPEDSEYYVAGAKVLDSEYEARHDEFDKTWQDTGYRNYAMIDPALSGLPDIHSKTVPMSL